MCKLIFVKTKDLDTQNLLLILIIVVFVAAGAFYLMFSKNGKENKFAGEGNIATLQMQLQAYERLILLTDRIALPNLISRTNQHGASAKEMQQMLLQSIKEEFNHNINS